MRITDNYTSCITYIRRSRAHTFKVKPDQSGVRGDRAMRSSHFTRLDDGVDALVDWKSHR